MVPARYRNKAASSGWAMVGSSQMYMEWMKSVPWILWASPPGGTSMLNGSLTSSIVVNGKDEDRRMGVAVGGLARVDDWPRGD